MGIQQINYVYAQRVDWKATLDAVAPGESKLAILTKSQYVLFRMGGKELFTEKGKKFCFSKIADNTYIITRID